MMKPRIQDVSLRYIAMEIDLVVDLEGKVHHAVSGLNGRNTARKSVGLAHGQVISWSLYLGKYAKVVP